MRARVVILGAGVAGAIVANRLARRLLDPLQPSPPTRFYHWAQALINQTYWATIPTGWI